MSDNQTTETPEGKSELTEHKFVCDGRTFETKAARNGDMYEVRVFEGDVAANRVIYSVSFNTRFDMARTGVDAIDELRTMAEDDFKRWNEWLKRQKKGEEDV